MGKCGHSKTSWPSFIGSGLCFIFCHLARLRAGHGLVSKINGGRSAVCDGARGFKVALLAVGVGQGWGAVEAV